MYEYTANGILGCRPVGSIGDAVRASKRLGWSLLFTSDQIITFAFGKIVAKWPNFEWCYPMARQEAVRLYKKSCEERKNDG